MNVASVTDVAPGATAARKRPSVLTSGGMAAGGAFALVVPGAQELDIAAERVEARNTNEALEPCLGQLARSMDELRVSEICQTALTDAFRRQGIPGDQVRTAASGLAESSVKLQSSSVLSVYVSAVTLRECKRKGSFCLEVELGARFSEPGANTSFVCGTASVHLDQRQRGPRRSQRTSGHTPGGAVLRVSRPRRLLWRRRESGRLRDQAPQGAGRTG